jgi:type II secretory pathway pseudopilin PulG
MRRKKNGFSLVESLISLTLFLTIFIASLEFFGMSRNVFFKLNREEKSREGASFALDKMRLDLSEAGRGLGRPIQRELLEGISLKDGNLILLNAEETFSLSSDLMVGQERISIDSPFKINKRRKLCLFDSEKGEVKSVYSSDKGSIVLSSPLDSNYSKEETSLILLRKTTYFLDEKTQILRRRINSSPAQPLLENVTRFEFSYDEATHLLRLQITPTGKKEQTYEILVFPKNVALAVRD